MNKIHITPIETFFLLSLISGQIQSKSNEVNGFLSVKASNLSSEASHVLFAKCFHVILANRQ